MASCNLASHGTRQQTELTDFINKSPSNDWAHLSSVVAKETANTCDRLKTLASEVCMPVVMVTAVTCGIGI